MHPTQKPDPYGEWMILGGKQGAGGPEPVDNELLAASREAWPHALAHARRELSDKAAGPDRTAVAAEIWERVLRSVARTRQRAVGKRCHIENLQSYLIGAFHVRFNRFLRKEQRRLDTIELVPSVLDLEKLASARDIHWVSELEKAIAVKTVLAHMDEGTRRIWRARQYGYSWKEIARRLGVTERHAKRKFRDGIDKTRQRILGVMRRRRENLKDQSEV